MAGINALTSNEYVWSLVILAGAILTNKIAHVILEIYAKRFAGKTKTDLDDLVLHIVGGPLSFLITIGGLYVALTTLSTLDPYQKWINAAFFLLTVFLVAYVASRICSLLVNRWFKVRKRFEKTPKLITKVTSVIIYIIALLMILSHFDIEITPLIATLGLGGLAVGLALQNTLTNFFAGVHIISDRPIDVGNYIELPDAKIAGYVDDIGWRSTRIRSLPNQIIIVPNSKLAESVIINNSQPEHEMAALVQVGVAYDSDLKKVEKVTVEVAEKVQKTIPGAVKTFKPFIRYHTFADSNINFSVILRVEKFVDKYLITHEFIKALKERYDKEGIEISWPVRKIYNAK